MALAHDNHVTLPLPFYFGIRSFRSSKSKVTKIPGNEFKLWYKTQTYKPGMNEASDLGARLITDF